MTTAAPEHVTRIIPTQNVLVIDFESLIGALEAGVENIFAIPEEGFLLEGINLLQIEALGSAIRSSKSKFLSIAFPERRAGPAPIETVFGSGISMKQMNQYGLHFVPAAWCTSPEGPWRHHLEMARQNYLARQVEKGGPHEQEGKT